MAVVVKTVSVDLILVGIGEFTAHFRIYCSGWIESDVHWGVTGILTMAIWYLVFPGKPLL